MADRPKLEIVRPDGEHIEVWIGGKEIASANHDSDGWNGMVKLEEVARDIARALGADIDVTDDPMRQPYLYRLAWAAGSQFGSCWHTRTGPIEDGDTEEDARRSVAQQAGITAPIVFLSIEYIDGPC